MIEKIDIYREVLAIEPNSKVFFPLAKALGQTGREDEAIEALRKGVAFHPDHVEARFLLIEILTRLGREDEAGEVFGELGDMLAGYPSVWLLWSRKAAAKTRDSSLALSFLARLFQYPDLTFAAVVEKGLAALSGQDAEAAPRVLDEVRAGAAAEPSPETAGPVAAAGEPMAPREPLPDDAAGVDESDEFFYPEAFHAAPSGPTRAPAGTFPDEPPLRGADEVMELLGGLEVEDPEALAIRTKPRVKTVKIRDVGIRTRTMAALLASQGDDQGALDIYQELLSRAPSEAEKMEIAGFMADIRARRGASPAAPAVSDQAGPAAKPGPVGPVGPVERAAPPRPSGTARLLGFLGHLAERLEARAGA